MPDNDLYTHNPNLSDAQNRYLKVLSGSKEAVPNLVDICKVAKVGIEDRLSWTDPVFVEENKSRMAALQARNPAKVQALQQLLTKKRPVKLTPLNIIDSAEVISPFKPVPPDWAEEGNMLLNDAPHSYKTHRNAFLEAMATVQGNPDKACDIIKIPRETLDMWARSPEIRNDINDNFKIMMGLKHYNGDLLLDRWQEKLLKKDESKQER